MKSVPKKNVTETGLNMHTPDKRSWRDKTGTSRSFFEQNLAVLTEALLWIGTFAE